MPARSPRSWLKQLPTQNCKTELEGIIGDTGSGFVLWSMQMRVLFLEFDGVLHPMSATARFAPVAPLKYRIQEAWLFRWAWILEELLDAHPDVGIIAHSNWRMLATDEELQSFLGPLAHRFIGSTPHGKRWKSIAQVVENNHLRNFAVLDPLPASFPGGLPQMIVCATLRCLTQSQPQNQTTNHNRTKTIRKQACKLILSAVNCCIGCTIRYRRAPGGGGPGPGGAGGAPGGAGRRRDV